MKINNTLLAIASLTFIICSPISFAEQGVEVVPVEDVKWQKLNPARGDKSPQAGTLWGDRKGAVPTGFLAKFVDGFSSPPHIHNATYRAVVIEGLIHNDDPSAANMWMPTGSFWTQPKGESHITSAKGSSNIALVEIDQGPYLVKHIDEAFDSGERPINIDPSNIIWLPLAKNSSQAKIAYLWGQPDTGNDHGIFIKLPAKFNGTIEQAGSTFRAVVIQGQLKYGKDKATALKPGSYFGASKTHSHKVSSSIETVIYIRSDRTPKVKAKP